MSCFQFSKHQSPWLKDVGSHFIELWSDAWMGLKKLSNGGDMRWISGLDSNSRWKCDRTSTNFNKYKYLIEISTDSMKISREGSNLCWKCERTATNILPTEKK